MNTAEKKKIPTRMELIFLENTGTEVEHMVDWRPRDGRSGESPQTLGERLHPSTDSRGW